MHVLLCDRFGLLRILCTSVVTRADACFAPLPLAHLLLVVSFFGQHFRVARFQEQLSHVARVLAGIHTDGQVSVA